MNKTSIICVYVIILTTHNNPDYNYTKEFLKVTFRALALRQNSLWWPIYIINPVHKAKLYCNTDTAHSSSKNLPPIFIDYNKNYFQNVCFSFMKDLNVLSTPVECLMAYSYISFLFVRNSILMVSSKKKL